MNSPKVKAADRIGDENVEKNSAIAVRIINSRRISSSAFNIAGSRAGASQACCTSAGTPHRMYASTAYKAAAMIATLTASVSVSPAYLPAIIW